MYRLSMHKAFKYLAVAILFLLHESYRLGKGSHIIQNVQISIAVTTMLSVNFLRKWNCV